MASPSRTSPLLGVLFSGRGQTKGRSGTGEVPCVPPSRKPEMVAKPDYPRNRKCPGITDADIEMQKREEKDIARAKLKKPTTKNPKALPTKQEIKVRRRFGFQRTRLVLPEDEHVLFGPPPKQ